MAQHYTNDADLPLSIAVWLATDNYNHDDSVVSVTKLIKPLRELILTDRVDHNNAIQLSVDVMSMLKSRKGTAVHESIEKAWKSDRLDEVLGLLGYPAKTAKNIILNPDPTKKLPKGKYGVYTEYTAYKDFDGLEFRGSSDFIFLGRLTDFKNTSTFGFVDEYKDSMYQLQGSIYRWMSPEIITDDTMDIVQMYDDWSKVGYLRSPDNYPPNPIMVKKIPLLTIRETEKYIRNKIKMIDELYDSPQSEIPECNDQELWRKPPVYKYYKNPQSKSRSTKNYDDYGDAVKHYKADGEVGVIDTVKSKVVACRFCAAVSVCEQAKSYLDSGQLEL